MEIPSEELEYFKQTGPHRVRLVFDTKGFGSPRQIFAGQWLAEIDEAARKSDEALQNEQLRIGQSTLNAAWIAVYVGLGAVGVGVIGIAVAILLWRFPRH
jgi:hypothetical protein